MIKMILILSNIILIVDANAIEYPTPSNSFKSNPIHTKILNPDVFNIVDGFFVNVYDHERTFYLFVEVRVEDFEVKPLVEADCISVVG